MEKDANKIVGTVSLEESLERFANESNENRVLLDAILKTNDLIQKAVDERNLLGITQRELATLTCIKQPMIARIERFESVPRLDTFVRIVDNLELDICLVSRLGFKRLSFDLGSLAYEVEGNSSYHNNTNIFGRYLKNEAASNAA